MSRRAPGGEKPKPPAGWAGRGLVALIGGPRHRWWYFADEAERMSADALHCRGWEHYRPTTKHVQHPEYDANGTVWRWSPARPS